MGTRPERLAPDIGDMKLALGGVLSISTVPETVVALLTPSVASIYQVYVASGCTAPDPSLPSHTLEILPLVVWAVKVLTAT